MIVLFYILHAVKMEVLMLIAIIVIGVLCVFFLLFGPDKAKESGETSAPRSDLCSAEPPRSSLEVLRPDTADGDFYRSWCPDDVKFYPPKEIISKLPNGIFIPGHVVVLKFEPNNPHDSGAVALYLSGHKIGYLLRGGLQDMVHEWSDKGWPVECFFVSIKKSHGEYQGYISLDFYRPVKDIPEEHRRLSYGDIDIKSFVPADPENIPATPLSGKKIVFCGYFELPLQDMMQKAVDSGATLRKVVTKTVDYLVVGSTNSAFLNEDGLSNKEVTASKLNDQGANIRIISEQTFLELTQINL